VHEGHRRGMLWYLVIFAALLCLAILEGGTRSRVPGYACGVILALVAGLRYETGFDWADYESHYLFTTPLGAQDVYASVTTIMVEPGFELLNRLLRTIGADFQVLLFICGTFSMFALTRLAARFSPLIGIVLLWFYGFLFLPAALGMLRQMVSVAFIYLAMIYANDKRYSRSIILSAVSLSIHYFSAAYLPIVFWNRKSPGVKAAAVTAVLGFAISSVGNNLFFAATDVVVTLTGGGFVADKMTTYSSFVGAQLSPFSLALVVWHLAFMWLVQRRRPEKSYIVEAGLLAAFLTILMHSLFAPLPILWNRMMLVSFPLEAVVLCRLYFAELSDINRRIPIILAGGLGAFLALTYTLLNPQSLVYTPYQNLAVVWIRGPYGTGRLRYQMVREDNSRLFKEQRIR
jgi:hypothetical protein